MNRRDLLKGLFGAAVVAAVPKPIFDQMVEASDKYPIPPVKEATPMIEKITDSSHALYLYDDEKLVGMSKHIKLNIHTPMIDIRNRGYYYPKEYIDYMPGPKSWDVDAMDIWWINVDPRGYIKEGNRLHCVCITKEVRLVGDVLMSQHTETAGMLDLINYDAVFTGVGALTMEANE